MNAEPITFAKALELVEKDQPGDGDVHVAGDINEGRKPRKPREGDAEIAKDAPGGEALGFRIAKVDEGLGLVFGWAIVCKVDGQDYYDLNIDKGGQHAGKRVPEHIPEDTMLKASTDFMLSDRVGNEMHAGPDSGTFAFAFPMTTEIAKAMGITTRKTGLMVAYKCEPAVLAKFRDGTYTGFSVEGRRLAFEEHS